MKSKQTNNLATQALQNVVEQSKYQQWLLKQEEIRQQQEKIAEQIATLKEVTKDYITFPNTLNVVMTSKNNTVAEIRATLSSIINAYNTSAHPTLNTDSRIIWIDDASDSATLFGDTDFETGAQNLFMEVLNELPEEQKQHWVKDNATHRLQVQQNSKAIGLSASRNIGAVNTSSRLVAFIDCPNQYEASALDYAIYYLLQAPSIADANKPNDNALIVLNVIPEGFPSEVLPHKDKSDEENQKLNKAWYKASMAMGSNLVVHRQTFLGMGAFPTDSVYQNGLQREAETLLQIATYGVGAMHLIDNKREKWIGQDESLRQTKELALFVGVRSPYKEDSALNQALLWELKPKHNETTDKAAYSTYYLASCRHQDINLMLDKIRWTPFKPLEKNPVGNIVGVGVSK